MDDLISRKDLMKKIAHHTVHDSMSYVTFERSTVYEIVKSDMFGLVKDAPAVASMPRWIRVEDEPPKNVYLQVYVAKFGCVEKAKYEGLLWRTSGGESLNIDWVTHWMPLPEPPKEEK